MSRQEKKVNLSDTLEKENLVEIVQVHSDDSVSKSRWRFRQEDLENHQTEPAVWIHSEKPQSNAQSPQKKNIAFCQLVQVPRIQMRFYATTKKRAKFM